jgi:hypothetical protein
MRKEPGGLSCDNCPWKREEPRWGAAQERLYCHGNKRPEDKTWDDGCAYLWPVWGAIQYYGEMAMLIEAGMPAPEHWTLGDWRLGIRIRGELERQALEERQADGSSR